MIWKISPLLLREILGMFLNSLTPEVKCPIEGWKNLALPIQMQLSEKLKTLSQFFVPFMESTSNFKHLSETENNRQSHCISEVRDCENLR